MSNLRSAAFATLAIAVLGIPAAGDAAPRPRAPGLYVDRVAVPRYEVRPNQVIVTPELVHVGKSSAREAILKISLTLVGATRPSDTDQVTISEFKPTDPSPVSVDLDVDVPIGRYKVKACVKYRYRGRREKHCRAGKDVSVIPPAWHGNSTWTLQFASFNNDGYRETAVAAPPDGARFRFNGAAGPAGFVYDGEGAVTYAVSGTDQAGCTHSGSQGLPIVASTLTLSPNLETYTIDGQRLQSQTFQATQTCPFGGSFPYPAPPFTPLWLSTGIQHRKTSATTLAGTNLEPALGGTWTWSFTAQDE